MNCPTVIHPLFPRELKKEWIKPMCLNHQLSNTVLLTQPLSSAGKMGLSTTFLKQFISPPFNFKKVVYCISINIFLYPAQICSACC